MKVLGTCQEEKRERNIEQKEDRKGREGGASEQQ